MRSILQLDHLWTGGKAIIELHKIRSIPRKYIRSSLAKQALYQIHILPPKEINHPHYVVTKPNEPHQFNLLICLIMSLKETRTSIS